MSSPSAQSDVERTFEFEFLRATENAALRVVPWLGRGDKEGADNAACDAIYGAFDLLDCAGSVVIGEGIKDNAPGIFLGEKLGRWKTGSPHFDIAIDPIDGTTNLSNGLPNAISVLAASASDGSDHRTMRNLPSFYSEKLAFGPAVRRAVLEGLEPPHLNDPILLTLRKVAKALGKRLQELVVVTLNRPRHQSIIAEVRRSGAALRLITDGDITAAIAPSLPDSGVDLYIGIGGSPEAVLTAAALKTLGGEMFVRQWPRDDAERRELLKVSSAEDLKRIYLCDDLVKGDSAIFCATGISDSALLPGVKLTGHKAVTSSILMRARSRTVRYVRAVHDLEHKKVPVRSESEPAKDNPFSVNNQFDSNPFAEIENR